jgi:hypothetical protein
LHKWEDNGETLSLQWFYFPTTLIDRRKTEGLIKSVETRLAISSTEKKKRKKRNNYDT